MTQAADPGNPTIMSAANRTSIGSSVPLWRDARRVAPGSGSRAHMGARPGDGRARHNLYEYCAEIRLGGRPGCRSLPRPCTGLGRSCAGSLAHPATRLQRTTTTGAPQLTRLYRSSTSALSMRMQP